MRRPLVPVLAVLGGLCLAGAKRPKADELARDWAPPAPDSEYHLRSTFDADPSSLLGRFVPDGVTAPDDGSTLVTRCSAYVTEKEVAAGGTYDVYVRASSAAAAAFGAPPVAAIGGRTASDQTVRIRYKLTKKLQYEVTDPAGWRACCAEGPGMCSSRFVSEFVAGDGELFFAVGKASSASATGVLPSVVGQVEAKDGYLWQQATTLDGMYFAFKTAEMPAEPALATGTCAEVAWDDAPPRSPDGLYLIGVSPRADGEQDARTLARTDARQQVLELCHGADVVCGGSSSERREVEGGAATSSSASGLDCEITMGGRVRSLQARATCTDHQDTPMGRGAWLVKAAYFLPGGCPGL